MLNSGYHVKTLKRRTMASILRHFKELYMGFIFIKFFGNGSSCSGDKFA